MQYLTWGEFREKIESEFDLQEEPDFLSPNEMCDYLNEAIAKCEKQFIKLGDYFLSCSSLNLIDNQRDYPLPEDIYATKIRSIMVNGRRIRLLKDLTSTQSLGDGKVTDPSHFLIINERTAGPLIRFFPIPSGGETVDIYYTRNATRINPEGDDNQEIDMPEAYEYLYTFVRMMLYKKEKQYPLMEGEKVNLAMAAQELADALGARVDTEENTIEVDASFYADMVGGLCDGY